MKDSPLAARNTPLDDPAGPGPDLATSLQQELRRGFPGLCFEPALEHAYREDQFRDGLKHLRINLGILLALVFTIVELDRVVIPAFSATVPQVARLGVMLPILATALALTFLRRGWRPGPGQT